MLEQLLIEHGAPTLASLKVGNLIQTAVSDDAAFEEERIRLTKMLAMKGVSITVLKKKDGHALIYLYRPQALKKLLSCPLIQSFLMKEGYRYNSLGTAVGTLRKRLNQSDGFPHEIGIFLGYPLEDVTSFIDQGGRNCVLCGCWKVYHNACQAQKTFDKFDHCRKVYTRLYQNGWSVERLTVAA